MTFESESRQRARRRRASGALVDFDGKRLSVARRLRRMQRTALAAQTSVTAAAITQYERGGRPTNTVAAELALAGISSFINADEAIDAMKSVGDALPCALKETAGGGMAATPSAIEWAAKYFARK